MSTNYIENYGFTKTIIKNNNKKINNEINWIGDYDGKTANIQVDINDNGNKELVTLQLDNNDIIEILGLQPVDISLEKRLYNDFLSHKSANIMNPIVLEGALINKHKRKYKKNGKKSTKRNQLRHSTSIKTNTRKKSFTL